MWNIYLLLIIGIGLYAFVLSASNLLFMYRNTRQAGIQEGPLISILIPARNEEASIGACLRSLCSQTYANIEILVLDDHSVDSTQDIVRSLMEKDPRIQLVGGKALPEGWNGKNFALQQLSEVASGSYYLLTDADTLHTPESVSFAFTNLLHHGCEMLSGYPKQLAPSLSTLAVVTAMHLNILFLNPLWLQKRSSSPLLGLAIGQYIFIKADCFHAIGGFSPIRDSITDDIHLARLLLSNGYHQVFLDAGSVVSCRMYDTFTTAMKGITRSVLDFLDKRIIIPLVALPFILACMVAPTGIVIFQLVTQGYVSGLLIIGFTLFILSWMQTMIFLRYPLKTIILFAPTMLIVVAMLLYGCLITITGKGYVWKDRIVK